jgi:hypothetical protein
LRDNPGVEEGRTALLILQQAKLRIDILGLSEVRWTGSDHRKFEQGYTIIHTGQATQHRNGVGFCLSPQATSALQSYVAISDRILLAMFRVQGNVPFAVIQVYAPTEQAAERDSEEFYEDLEKVIHDLPLEYKSNYMVLGDFNAQVCSMSRLGGCVGPFAMGKRTTANGDRMLHFCYQHGLAVKNTFFRHQPSALYTWYSPDRRTKNQIDHCLMPTSSVIKVMDCRAMNGARGVLGSDHALLMCEVRANLSPRPRRARKSFMDVHKLKDGDICAQYRDEIAGLTAVSGDVDEKWENIKVEVLRAARQYLSCSSSQRKCHPYLTQETLDAIEAKRRAWNVCRGIDGGGSGHAQRAYAAAKNNVKRLVKRDKRVEREESARRIEQMSREHQLMYAYKMLYQMGAIPKVTTTQLVGPDGRVPDTPEGMQRMWRTYFETLLNCRREVEPNVWEALPTHTPSAPMLEDPPTWSEVEGAIKGLCNGKAAGVCELKAELLKFGGKDLSAVLHDLLRRVWESEKVPEEWRQAILVPIPKAGDKRDVKNYRGICVQSVAAKVYSTILKKRLRHWSEEALLEVQNGFRGNRGCADAIFVLRRIIDQHVIKNKQLHICFIDIAKAYDSVDRDTAWNTLLHRGAPPKIIRLLRDMHHGTTCTVRAPGLGLGEQFAVETGFKQGDVISPMLFNLYMDSVVRDVMPIIRQRGIKLQYNFNGRLEEIVHGKVTHEDLVWILLYADDIALMAEDLADLQFMLTELDAAFKRWGLLINVQKTKVMSIEATGQTRVLQIAGQAIENVATFKYLGQHFSSNGSIRSELTHRVGKAYAIFRALDKQGIWREKLMTKKTKLIFYKTLVRSVLLYCAETWPATNEDVRKLEAVQMYCVRRICGYSAWGTESNEEIRVKHEIPSIENVIRYHRLRWLGHVARMDPERLPVQVLFGWIEGKRPIGRPRKTWIDTVRDDLRVLSDLNNKRGTFLAWQTLTQDRGQWRDLIHSLVDTHT